MNTEPANALSIKISRGPNLIQKVNRKVWNFVCEACFLIFVDWRGRRAHVRESEWLPGIVIWPLLALGSPLLFPAFLFCHLNDSGKLDRAIIHLKSFIFGSDQE